jgi:ABC-type branched-subunit amino acid transport system substrate-binding protein
VDSSKGSRHRRGLGVLGLLAATCALVAAGCGSSDSNTSSSAAPASTGSASTGSSTAASGGDKTPIKFGMIAPLANPIFSMEASIAGAKSAIRAINADGGINGHPIELIVCNDKNDPNESTKCARQMIDEKVVATVGSQSLAGTLITPILNKAGIPQVGTAPLAPSEAASPNMWPYFMGQNDSIGGAAWIGTTGSKVSFTSVDNPSAFAYLPQFQALIKANGGSFVNKVKVPATQGDYSPIVEAAQASGANAIDIQLGLQQTKQLVDAAVKDEAPFKYYMMAAENNGLLNSYPVPFRDKLVYFSAFPPPTSTAPGVTKLKADLAAELASGDKDATEDRIDDYLQAGWLAPYAIKAIMADKGDDITAASLQSALESAKDVDMMGMIPPWTPSTPGPEFAKKLGNTAVTAIGFKDGKAVALSGPTTYEQAAKGDIQPPA